MACEQRDKAIALFKKTFEDEPSIFAYAPGRVNFIGEHTDYCEGFVCPLAIHYGTAVVGKAVPGNVLPRVGFFINRSVVLFLQMKRVSLNSRETVLSSVMNLVVGPTMSLYFYVVYRFYK